MPHQSNSNEKAKEKALEVLVKALEPNVFLAQSFQRQSREYLNLFSRFACIAGPVVHLKTGAEISNSDLVGAYVSNNTNIFALASHIMGGQHAKEVVADIIRLKKEGIRHCAIP